MLQNPSYKILPYPDSKSKCAKRLFQGAQGTQALIPLTLQWSSNHTALEKGEVTFSLKVQRPKIEVTSPLT